MDYFFGRRSALLDKGKQGKGGAFTLRPHSCVSFFSWVLARPDLGHAIGLGNVPDVVSGERGVNNDVGRTA